MNRYGLNLLTSALVIALAAACGTKVAKVDPKAAIGPVTPEQLLLTAPVDTKVTDSFFFTNTGGAPLTYQVEESSDWLTLTAGASGTVEPGVEQTVSFEAACGSTAESRTAQVTVRASDAALEARALEVVLSCTMGRSLVVTLTGLPANTEANVTVTGPESFSRTLTASTALTNLQPGEYTVSATRVTVGELPYDPTPETQSVGVNGTQGGVATIAYGVAKGSLDVNVTGSGVVTPTVTITGPANFEQVVNATTHLTDLVEGTYTITADDARSGLATYVPATRTQTQLVVKGQTASVDVSYAVKLSSLEITVEGLPAGVDPALTVTTPTGSYIEVTESTTLNDIEPGTYLIDGGEVADGDFVYKHTQASVDVSSDAAASITVTYSLLPGAFDLAITGLPAGATPSVLVEGPNSYSQTFTADVAGASVEPGDYTLTPADVKIGNVIYRAASAQKHVASKATSTFDVAYAVVPSALTVTITGLPTGVDANVVLAGPNSFQETLTATWNSTTLLPGAYTITANDVVIGDTIYRASGGGFTLGSENDLGVSVDYAIVPGSLTVNVDGLPTGTDGNVTVTGPNSFSQTVATTWSSTTLLPGDYTITPAEVTVGTAIYRAVSSTASLASEGTITKTVTYAVVSGSLTVTVAGLPTGTDGNVTVTGPSSFSQTVATTWTSDVLLPGDYTITPADVTIGDSIYRATSTTASLGSEDDVEKTITYAIVPGKLTVTIAGLPASTDGNVTVTGPNSFSQTVTTTWNSATLTPGDYTITPADVTVGSAIYHASSTTVSLGSEDDESRTITYAAVPAKLTVTIAGLPASTDGNVTVTGPNSFSQSVTTTWNSATLTPGTYTITANDVTIGSSIYRASSTTADLASNDDVSKTITYAIVPGKLTVTIAGLPAATGGNVTVTGPNSFTQAVTTTWNSATLTPGTYTITPADVTVGSAIYRASSTTVDLGSENDLSRTITYAVVPAKLTVTIEGLPTGTDANVTITGPNSFSQTLTATTTLATLAPGTYTITPADVVVSTVTYSSTSTTVTLASSDDVSKTITYASGATLTVTISGLPNGVNAAVKITGPDDFEQTLTTTTTLTSLTPGEYLVTPDEVFDGLTNYMSGSEASLTLTTSPSSHDVTYAQAWAKAIVPSGSTSTQVDVNDLYVDAQGNTFVVGYTTGALEGQTYVGGLTDAFLIKYNARGELVWARQFGSASNDWADSVMLDELGAIYVGGETLGEFGSYGSTTNTKMGSNDVFVAKFASNGTPLWTRMWGTAPRDQSSRVVVENAVDGSVYLIGETSGRPTNPTNATPLTTTDGLVVSLNRESGELNWVNNIAATSSTREVANDGVVASNGDLIVTGLVGQGAFSGTGVTVNTTNLSPHTDMFLIRYAKDGTRLWVRQVGDEYHDVGNGLALDADGNIYVAGQWNYTPSTTTGKTNNTGSSFVRRFASDGSDTGGWAQYIDTLLASEQFSSIAINSAGQLAVTGRYDTAGFAVPGETNAGGTDGFVAVYSAADGTRTFLKQFGSTGTDVPRAIVWGPNNTMLVSGWSGAALPGLTFKGSQDGWVAKFKP